MPTRHCFVCSQASLCLAAIREHQRTGKGHFVNYNTLPDSMWEKIVPKYFEVPLSEKGITQMKNISRVYSKGADNTSQKWSDTKKNVTKEQQKSAHQILEPYFRQMEKISRHQHR